MASQEKRLAMIEGAEVFAGGDVRHSQADIGKVQRLLGYAPPFDIQAGIAKAMPWYVQFLRGSKA